MGAGLAGLALLPSGTALGKSLPPSGPEFLHLYVDGVFIEHLLYVGMGCV